MKKQIFNFLPELLGADEIEALKPGAEKEGDNSDNHAFYFLTIVLIMIVTFSLFKQEILHLLF